MHRKTRLSVEETNGVGILQGDRRAALAEVTWILGTTHHNVKYCQKVETPYLWERIVPIMKSDKPCCIYFELWSGRRHVREAIVSTNHA